MLLDHCEQLLAKMNVGSIVFILKMRNNKEFERWRIE